MPKNLGQRRSFFQRFVRRVNDHTHTHTKEEPMKINPIILLVSTLACIELASSQDESAIGPALMKSKVKTDRTVSLDAIVDASPAEVSGSGHQPTASKSFLPQRRGLIRKSADVTKSSFFRRKILRANHTARREHVFSILFRIRSSSSNGSHLQATTSREKRAALCPAVGAQSQPLADLGGAILRTSGGPTEPDSREIGALWIPRRRKVGPILSMVYTRMARRARPIVEYCQKQKSSGISKRHDRWWVLTASKIEKESYEHIIEVLLLLRGGISSREL